MAEEQQKYAEYRAEYVRRQSSSHSSENEDSRHDPVTPEPGQGHQSPRQGEGRAVHHERQRAMYGEMVGNQRGGYGGGGEGTGHAQDREMPGSQSGYGGQRTGEQQQQRGGSGYPSGGGDRQWHQGDQYAFTPQKPVRITKDDLTPNR